jgi:hypothetical protein
VNVGPGDSTWQKSVASDALQRFWRTEGTAGPENDLD